MTEMTQEEYYNALHQMLDFTIYIGKNCFPKKAKPPIDRRIVYATPLLIRALHKAHAIDVLIKNKLYDESEIMLRILIEISFIIVAIAEKPDFIEKYINSITEQKLANLKNLKHASEYKETLLSLPAHIDNEIKWLEEVKKKTKSKKLTIFDYAREAGLLAHYYSTYSILCSRVHSGPEDTQDYFTFDESTRTFNVKKPIIANADLTLFTATEAMLRIHKAYLKLHGVKHDKKINELENGHTFFNNLLFRKYKLNENIFS